MSAKTLLCLLSEQRMQNIIPLFQRRMHFDRVVLLASEENGEISPRFAPVANDIIKALSERFEVKLHCVPVDPMSPEHARKVCKEIIDCYDGPGQVTVNFTGGTKPMSIGAYLAGQECGAELLYVDTQAEKFYYYKEGRKQEVLFDLEPIGVELMLTAHRRQINHDATQKKELSPAELRVAELIFQQRCNSSFNSLRAMHIMRQQMVRHTNNPKIGRPLIKPNLWKKCPGLLEACIAEGFIDETLDDYCLNNAGFNFFNGSWLEAYVFLALRKSDSFADVEARVMIEGIENELDVACTLNAKLGVIECKTGKIGQNELNRLKALRETLGGVFSKSFLVVPYGKSRIPEQTRARAEEYVSCLIDEEDLDQVEKIVRSEMLKTRR